MTKAAPRLVLWGGYALFAIAALTACGTPPPADFAGDWQPVNRYAETTAEIPLAPAYLFQPTPIDGTLKKMLERWASDAGLKLTYGLTSDFTLHKPVSRIRTTDLQAAVSELSLIYAPQGLSVQAEDKHILVRPSPAQQPAPAT